MTRTRSAVTAVLAGAVVGALVLGVLGRIAMRVLAVQRGAEGGFSVGGTLEVIVVSVLYGGLGGLILGLLGIHRARRPLVGLAVGLALFGVAVLTSEAARAAAMGLSHAQLRGTLVVAAVLFAAWGLGTSAGLALRGSTPRFPIPPPKS